MSLAGFQINPIDVNFDLQKSLDIFDTNSADKIQSQNYKGGKSALPRLPLGVDFMVLFFLLLSNSCSQFVIKKFSQ